MTLADGAVRMTSRRCCFSAGTHSADIVPSSSSRRLPLPRVVITRSIESVLALGGDDEHVNGAAWVVVLYQDIADQDRFRTSLTFGRLPVDYLSGT